MHDLAVPVEELKILYEKLREKNIALSWNELHKNCRLILNASKFAQLRVQNLVDLSQLETSNWFKMKFSEPFSVHTMAKNVIDTVTMKADRNQTRVILAMKPLTVRTDKNRVE